MKFMFFWLFHACNNLNSFFLFGFRFFSLQKLKFMCFELFQEACKKSNSFFLGFSSLKKMKLMLFELFQTSCKKNQIHVVWAFSRSSRKIEFMHFEIFCLQMLKFLLEISVSTEFSALNKSLAKIKVLKTFACNVSNLFKNIDSSQLWIRCEICPKCPFSFNLRESGNLKKTRNSILNKKTNWPHTQQNISLCQPFTWRTQG